MEVFIIFLVFLTPLLANGNIQYTILPRLAALQRQQHYLDLDQVRLSGSKEILQYLDCIQSYQQNEDKKRILDPFYEFVLAGFNISLSCSTACRVPESSIVQWTKISFENQTEILSPNGPEFMLTIVNLRPQISTYYCTWELHGFHIVSNIWTVEVVAPFDVERTMTRKWNKNINYLSSESQLEIFMSWGLWSDCNRCDTAGKRHRLGHCSVKKHNPQKDNRWPAMDLYDYMSCNLLLHFHPEIGTVEPSLVDKLSVKPVIMIGYCKQPCHDLEFDPKIKFSEEIPDAVQLMYLGKDFSQSVDLSPVMGFSGKLRKLQEIYDVPLGAQYIPEMIAFTCLLLFQCFIAKIPITGYIVRFQNSIGNKMGLPNAKKLAKFFYYVHGITVMVSSGFILSAYFTYKAESDSVRHFKLNITRNVVIVYYGCGALLVFAAFTGFMAQRKSNKPVLWITYCIIMAILALMELAVGGSALGKVSNYQSVETILLEQMEEYSQDQTITYNWDELQTNYECCGILDYTVWQEVRYGRTSLKVPPSCCLPELRNNTRCGRNLLPDHPHADEKIYTRGCLPELIRGVNFHLTIMGLYGIMFSILQALIVSFSCFLIITKKL